MMHEYCDVDDQWDLAHIYALAAQGHLDLRGVLFDYRPAGVAGDPAIAAVAQLNYLTGMSVPSAVGSPRSFASYLQRQGDGSASERSGAEFVLKILSEAPDPVVITTHGSCRDLAIAADLRLDLFAEKCAAVYLSGGTSLRAPDAPELEYNVSADPSAFAAMFDLPCPIYWAPCFERLEVIDTVGENKGGLATFYKFNQGEVLPKMSDGMQKYMLYALSREPSHRWLRYLERPIDDELLSHYARQDRDVGGPGFFFHAAGLSVTLDGEIVPLKDVGDKAVFSYEPAHVTCDAHGRTSWQLTSEPTNRFMFNVRSISHYPSAMTEAMAMLHAASPIP